ncbi:unnamed protein product [Linum trigynum]|uniref:Secreted protein n=1 Tax=Linum trigynum TaxID=586398 RepID=A0AAV2GBS3_9ROSI
MQFPSRLIVLLPLRQPSPSCPSSSAFSFVVVRHPGSPIFLYVPPKMDSYPDPPLTLSPLPPSSTLIRGGLGSGFAVDSDPIFGDMHIDVVVGVGVCRS